MVKQSQLILKGLQQAVLAHAGSFALLVVVVPGAAARCTLPTPKRQAILYYSCCKR